MLGVWIGYRLSSFDLPGSFQLLPSLYGQKVAGVPDSESDFTRDLRNNFAIPDVIFEAN